MATASNIICGRCKEQDLRIDAIVWCNNCKMGLCFHCKNVHKSLQHGLLDIDTKKVKPFVVSINVDCKRHYNDKLDFYCPCHLTPCCAKCVNDEHSTCTGIKKIKEVVKEFADMQKHQRLEKEMNEQIVQIGNLISDRQNTLMKLQNQENLLKNSVRSFRQKINNTLDRLEDNIYTDINTFATTEIAQVSQMINKLQTEKLKLQGMIENIQTLKGYELGIESFIGMHNIESQFHKNKRSFVLFNEENGMNNIDLQINLNEEAEVISISSFGNCFVRKSPRKDTAEGDMFKEAQIWSRRAPTFNIRIVQHKTIDVKTTLCSDMTDIVSLTDGHVILVNHFSTIDNGELLLFDSNLEFKKRLLNSGRPWGITQTDSDTIVVSYPNQQSIKLISLETEQVITTVRLSQKGYGITLKYDSIIIGGLNNFQILNLEGKVVKNINIQTKSRLSDIVCINEKFVYTDQIANSVHCVDSSGNETWRVVNDYIKRPCGVCADNHGNIFIACSKSDSIVMISEDGRKSCVLLGNGDVSMPTAISWNTQDSSLIVCHTNDKKLTKFKLAYT